MHIETTAAAPSEWKTDLLVLILDGGSRLFDLQDPTLQTRLDSLSFDEGGLEGEYVFEARHRDDIGAVMVVSTESEKGYGLWEGAKTFASRAVQLAARTGRKKVTFALNGAGGAELASRVVEGALVGTYSFQRYKKTPRDRYADLTVELALADAAAAARAVDEGRTLAEAVNAARDLVNEPADVVTPESLAEKGREIAAAFGYEFEEWDEARLAAEEFNGLVAVGKGSKHPPRMFRITANPAEPSPGGHHLVLVGKAVTFDTGGISIKPAENMHQMKGDMSGGAAVLAAMQALGRLKPQVKVTAVVVSAENTPDANAMRPGDIIVYKNGKSVHVENTDAEGRLILADGLWLAGHLGATHIVDIATLTGACARALGPSFTGLMGNNRELVTALTRAGGTQGESMWKLPLPAEYKELLKTPVADLKNVGGPAGGAITAGLFLQEFVPEGAAWCHLDIAGPFWRSKAWKYYAEGPTGVGVRTLTELAWHWRDYIASARAAAAAAPSVIETTGFSVTSGRVGGGDASPPAGTGAADTTPGFSITSGRHAEGAGAAPATPATPAAPAAAPAAPPPEASVTRMGGEVSAPPAASPDAPDAETTPPA